MQKLARLVTACCFALLLTTSIHADDTTYPAEIELPALEAIEERVAEIERRLTDLEDQPAPPVDTPDEGVPDADSRDEEPDDVLVPGDTDGPPQPGPTVPDAGTPVFKPGGGWDGSTPTPARIGSAKERAIAHWNVVPEQTVSDGFTVGIVAHHLDGIDRVEIAGDGGEWVTITEPSINPRTNCEEYWAVLDLDGQNTVRLRAVVYPKQGQPFVVLTPGTGQDLYVYGNARGDVLELPAGRHELKPRDMPTQGWLTVRPAPGVDREDCILVGRSRYWGRGNVRVQNITIETPQGGGVFVGDPNQDAFRRVWFDSCDFKGKPETWHLATVFDHSIYTDCTISDTQNVWTRSGQMLVRNVTIRRVYEDVIRTTAGLFVNLEVQLIDRDPFEDYHPDFFQARNAGNGILQDVTIEGNAGQGIFPEVIRDMAFVRVNMKQTGSGRAIQFQGETQNVLFKGGNYEGGGAFRESKGFTIPSGERVVFDGVGIRDNFREELLNTPRVEVRP